MTANHLLCDVNGEVAAPDAPGLGMGVDEEAVGRYLRTVEIRVDGETLFESRLPRSQPGS